MAPLPITSIVKPDQHINPVRTSQNLETVFIEQFLEMIGSSSPSVLESENHDDKFNSFLRHEHAKIIVAKGGIGLSEMIIRSLSKPEAADHA